MYQFKFGESRRLLSTQLMLRHTSKSRTGVWREIREGVFPPGFSISRCEKAWFEFELDAINEARARGADDDERRALVECIVEMRKVIGTEAETQPSQPQPTPRSGTRATTSPAIA